MNTAKTTDLTRMCIQKNPSIIDLAITHEQYEENPNQNTMSTENRK